MAFKFKLTVSFINENISLLEMDFTTVNELQTKTIGEISTSGQFNNRRHWNDSQVRLVLKNYRPFLEDKLYESESFLDIGCGKGDLVKHVQIRFPHVKCHGFDLIPNYSKRVEFKHGDAHNLPYEDESMDIVLCLFALPYMTDKLKVISEAYRVLKPNGFAVMNVWQCYFQPHGKKLIPEFKQDSDLYWDPNQLNVIIDKKGKGFDFGEWKFKESIPEMESVHYDNSLGSVYERLI
ncbi:class I SAM-dependent methyltransferase [Candidatus Woesearchaeota archaeon]|nr:class I SAM-dependent methyltransferase [Candidatus Woesearchaeota archaeon]